MAPQVYNWTCSICAADWLLRATGLNPHSSREQVCAEIGYPSCVDAYSGLKDTACLIDVLAAYGVEAHQEWVDWPRAIALAQSTAFILNSTSWYHFVGGRGTINGSLWVANSAPGYQSIWDVVDASDWNRLPGWQMVWLEH